MSHPEPAPPATLLERSSPTESVSFPETTPTPETTPAPKTTPRPETTSRPETTPIPDPTDLGRVGVRASEYLEAWAGNDRRTVVVLDSVTAMLAEVTLERVFHFLDLLADRIESVDGRGYYLVDPTAHADHVLNVLRELPESVVGFEDSPEAPEA
jgi:hypothetical protein